MPKALAVLFEFMRSVNKLMNNKKMSKSNAKKAIKLMLWFDRILGLKLEEVLKEKPLPKKVKELIEKREKARKKKNYKLADKIRKELREKYGIILEDTKDGVRWKWAS
jgi:cysteinyl-tRNA synthetase